MRDQFDREINYLRLSITERCALRCIYCRAEEGFCPKAEELSAETLVNITRACAELGVDKVRITGGEPLLRRDLSEIISGIRNIESIKEISLTTNAQDLAGQALELKRAGLDRVNISMDSLKPDRFQALTGGSLEKVLEGIHVSLTVGLLPVKVNCVLMKGVNDDEVDDFIGFTRDKPVQVRFIEYMPIGGGVADRTRVNHTEILLRRPDLQPVLPSYTGQPSRDYQIDGYQGKVGFISPISHQFCYECNRIRVMSDGTLRACLGQEEEVSLRNALKEGHQAVRALIQSTIYKKPTGHQFGTEQLVHRNMSRIGG